MSKSESGKASGAAGKGGKGGGKSSAPAPNLPSTTGKHSGGGRGNAPAKGK